MLRCKEWNDEIAIENTSNGEVRILLRVTPLSLTEKFRDQILCYRFATKIREKMKSFVQVSLTKCNGQY